MMIVVVVVVVVVVIAVVVIVVVVVVVEIVEVVVVVVVLVVVVVVIVSEVVLVVLVVVVVVEVVVVVVVVVIVVVVIVVVVVVVEIVEVVVVVVLVVVVLIVVVLVVVVVVIVSEKCKSKPREVWFIYAGMGSQWVGMARNLMEVQVFRKSIENSARILKPLGVDLINFLMEGTEETLRTIVNPFVCITSIQVALTDLLWSMGIQPDGIVGHSMGEVGCAYCDGCLTAEEAVLTSYWRGKCVADASLAPGKMAAVGLTWEEAKTQCPPGVVPACHNAEDSVTISGAADAMLKFMEELKGKGVFVREVNSSNVAYHSYFMEKIHGTLKAALNKVKVTVPANLEW
ncbi:fatty acid synthase-like [Elysia marginata]|uniref:Fatty acid synthase-like n=1 Tax=Elysia marginata TaxID=1093978 RepID=A0AAV4FHN2_9GAST|nr:fatty acid synthase-like [Elysia marginata]